MADLGLRGSMLQTWQEHFTGGDSELYIATSKEGHHV